MFLISSSVMTAVLLVAPKSRPTHELSASRMKDAGRSTQPIHSIGRAMMMETSSGRRAAAVLGSVSPKISSKTVTVPVAMSTAWFSLSKMDMAIAVASAARPVLTRLLPSRMGGSSFSGRSVIWATRAAPAVRMLTRC